MNETDALAYLEIYSEPLVDPQLPVLTLEMVLRRYVEEDGTYNEEGLLKAIADAWDIKANKATDHIDVSVNGRNMSASQVKNHCEERAKFYRRRLPVHVC
jgi:hypothetical protein